MENVTHDCGRLLLSCCGTQTVQTVAALLLASSKPSAHFRCEPQPTTVLEKNNRTVSTLRDLQVAPILIWQTFDLVSPRTRATLGKAANAKQPS